MSNIKELTNELHKAFHIFNKAFFNNSLSEPSITIQSRGNKKNVLGWCTVLPLWKDSKSNETKYEIAIIGEYLNRGLYPVMSTLLHEMVHLYHLQNGIKDVSRNGTYHNKTFKATAENCGLIVDHDKKIGWSYSKLSQQAMQLIQFNNLNEDIFSLYRRDIEEVINEGDKDSNQTDGVDEETTTPSTPKSSSKKYICPLCGIIVRATKEVNIICGDCQESLVLE